MRLNKFISETGVCSRREADEWIAAGRVTVNGARAGVGTVVGDGDSVAVDGRVITAKDKPRAVYIALNKPVGIVCTTERTVDGNIVDFVDHPERVFPIGRLDKESEGLILLTNDGDIVNEVLRVENDHEKEYVVGVDRNITSEFLGQMSRGVRIDVGHTRPCKVRQESARVFRIILTQGLNRQIRKMCEVLGYNVEMLQRVRVMHIELGHLKVGRWRNLSEAEVAGLKPKGDARPAAPPPRPNPQAPQHPQKAKPKPKPAAIPFGQPGGVGGRPIDTRAERRGGRGGPRRGR
ncbi:MAG TPA: pseudouridine synthase [Kofleriaceae bacterium]|nr:pseudouridine synthase [Kofleriaceae bacterium]